MRAEQYELLLKEKHRDDSIMNHLYTIILGFMFPASSLFIVVIELMK
ncbi:hypothetical protein [Staphylococcus felis]|nr:hypothetical protein [Staphylococcus felis]QQB03437.1 hypothetical protein I6H71_00220 [Staphylococcus felis]